MALLPICWGSRGQMLTNTEAARVVGLAKADGDE